MEKLTRRITINSVIMVLFLSTSSLAYDYPFADPYVATVVGTPTEYMEALPSDVPVKFETLQMFPEREVPGILWNLDELRYSYIRQKGPAPLIFMIAGTGANFNSPKMQEMQKAFYQAGYHVISISSPTHPNFIVAASTSGVPGHLEEDSADLYKVMQAIWQKHQKKMAVTDFFLTGYSLGAAQSAFIARLDEQEKAFNFRKVLLINPPVSLYNSVLILDELLDFNIPGGMDNFDAFYGRIVNAFADVYANGENVEFNNDFLYRAYEFKKPQSDDPLEALIGISFRISSANMVFTTDVLTKAGYVVPKNLVLRRHDNVTNYGKVLTRLSFLDYFRGIFLPHFQAKDPSVTEAQLIKTLSLRSLDGYLRNSAKFGLIGNEDDVILLPGEIDYLRDLFGTRATIFPHGGHCGNMAYPDNVSAMVGFFADVKN
jgi:hypothetical protein